ncbi:hypothetical protein [Mycolicibacterium sp. 120270]|uniref:hypothetical protein n=1 Tax=Mycolicibacterium sp. 120270 TaxID=3090600 RepID=UPI00299D11B0|nr:hypothetical protein [Mycolicibacterium sp. 120270]MDX1887708.1 hypothetical protein [Mycolicibacterium sp. 120270]
MLCAGLALLTTTQVVVGIWALLLPERFFSLAVVGMGMAYNEHLMRDYGAMTLASAVVLGAAAIRMDRCIVRTALVMYLVWAVPHFFIHVTMLDHLPAATGVLLLILLGAAIVIPAVLLVIAKPVTDNGNDLSPR